MVKFAPFHARFRLIRDIKYPIVRISVDDFSHRSAIFAGEGFVHTVLHDVGKFTQHRHVICQPVVVVDTSDFRVELGDDFDIGMIDELATVYRFPDFFSSFVILDFECVVFQQFPHPFFFRNVQHDSSAVLPFRDALLIVFDGVTA